MGVSKLKIMCRQNYFQQSLSNFTLEAASGGAIRHLADLGLSAKQISEKLTFPTPFEVVKKILWQRLVDSGVVLLEEPGSGEQYGKPVYTVDHDKFGKTSFRMITPERKIAEKVNWREPADFSIWKARGGRAEELTGLLAEKCKVNGEKEAYVSCCFGLGSGSIGGNTGEFDVENAAKGIPKGSGRDAKVSAQSYDAVLEVLNGRQREYISGLLWEPKVCYHRLDLRMREIIVKLYTEGLYHGSCYFLNLKEKIEI